MGEALVTLGGYGGDGGVHFQFFGGFFGKGLGVGCGFVGEDFDVAAFHFLVLWAGLASRSRRKCQVEGREAMKKWETGNRWAPTLQLGHFHSELVALFEDALAAFGNEVVEAVGKFCHALSELVEAEVDAGEGVGH